MSAGYDGTIKIDTSINAKGVNSGVKSITNAFGNILKTVKTIGTTLAKAFSVGALVLFSASIGKILSTIRESMGELFKRSGSKVMAAVEEIQSRFAELKLAVANAFLPLVIAALPYIKMVISWLTKAMNYLSMFFAALMGQKQVLQVIEGSTQAVAENMENTTKEAKKALGALAGFDQINVLDTQQDTPATVGGPDLTDTATTTTELVPITSEVLDKVEKIKEWLAFIVDKWHEFAESETAKNIIEALEWVRDRLLDISKWIKENPEAFKVILIVVGLLALAFLAVAFGVGVVTSAMTAWTAIVAVASAATAVFGIVMAVLASPIFIIIGIILLLIGVIAVLVIWWPVLEAAAAWAWRHIQEIWGNVSKWFQETVIDPLKKWFSNMWDHISEIATTAWNKIKAVWALVGEWFKSHVVEPIKNYFLTVWDNIGQTASNAWLKISEIWGEVSAWFSENILNPLVRVFSNAWNAIGDMASNAWVGIQDVFSRIGSWLRDNVGDPIQNTFETALDWVQEKWSSVFDAIGEFVKGIINNIIGALNGLLEGAVIGINGLIDGANLMGSIVPGWSNIPTVGAPQIPFLATGAVIPPNAQFAAILGDQKSGMNIETPVALMQKTFDESLARALANQSIHISFDGDLGSLVRELKPRIDKENARIGGSLLKGS